MEPLAIIRDAMPYYRRWRAEGGVFFFTLVTHERRTIFDRNSSQRFLRRAFRDVRRVRPFKLDAIVLLPDHLHMLMRLPTGDNNYSRRISGIKRNFTETFLAAGGPEGCATPARKRQRYRGVWQKRFWEHTIRDYEDFKNHLDYIHANPVKHGLVNRPRDWPLSSFHRYLKLGAYEKDWCGPIETAGLDIPPEFW